MELVLVGNSLNIFGGKVKTKMYFFVNYIKHIFALLPLEKLLAIKTLLSEPCYQNIVIIILLSEFCYQNLAIRTTA